MFCGTGIWGLLLLLLPAGGCRGGAAALLLLPWLTQPPTTQPWPNW
jgi:hypothetical protein